MMYGFVLAHDIYFIHLILVIIYWYLSLRLSLTTRRSQLTRTSLDLLIGLSVFKNESVNVLHISDKTEVFRSRVLRTEKQSKVLRSTTNHPVILITPPSIVALRKVLGAIATQRCRCKGSDGFVFETHAFIQNAHKNGKLGANSAAGTVKIRVCRRHTPSYSLTSQQWLALELDENRCMH
ncbi:hypothetical protein AB1N83_010398 [Pleurotus pulmonarius]